MRGVAMHAPGDVRVEDRDDPTIIAPTDAIIGVSASCICGSDLGPYRGIEHVHEPAALGHEYVGILEEIGSEVQNTTPGQFVVGSFFASDNTCEICQAGYHSSCIHRMLVGLIGTQAQRARIPLADGTLVATPGLPPAKLIPSLLAVRREAEPSETATEGHACSVPVAATVRRSQPLPARRPSSLPRGSTFGARTTPATCPRRRGWRGPGTRGSSNAP